MSFCKNFIHKIESITMADKQDDISNYLPQSIEYSADAAEHIMYLKAAGTATYPQNTKYTQKNFNAYALFFTYSGNASIQQDDTYLELKENSLAFIDCREEYTLQTRTNWRHIAIYFDGYPTTYYYSRIKTTQFPIDISVNPSLLQFLEILTKETNKEHENCRFLTELLTVLISITNDANDTLIPTYLQQIKRQFEQDYNQPFNLEQLASQYNTNRYQICRDFQKYYNCSPIKFLTNIRIEQSKILLLNSTLQANEISWKIGYENVNNFIQAFKKATGSTPLQYRKRGY